MASRRGPSLPGALAVLAAAVGCQFLPSPPPCNGPFCPATAPPGPSSTPASKSDEGAARATFQAAAPLNRPRFGFAYATLADRIFVFGGGLPGTASEKPEILDTIEVYDPVSDTWSTVGKLPEPRFGAAAAAFASQIYIAGGCLPQGESGAATDSVLTFDPATRAVAPAKPLPYKAWGLALAVTPGGDLLATGGDLLAAGGYDGPPILLADFDKEGAPTALARTARLAGDAGWTDADDLPAARALAVLVAVGGATYLVGGRGPGTASALGPPEGKIFRYLRKRWSEASDVVEPVSGAMAAEDGTRSVLVAGGLLGPPPSPAAGFSLGARRAYMLVGGALNLTRRDLPELPSGTALGGAGVVGGKAYVFGGVSGPINDVRTHAETYVLRDLPW